MQYARYTLLYISSVCVLAIAGCTIGPDFQPPAAPVPPSWTTGIEGQKNAAVDLVNWWTQFDDPNLTSLINRAVASNLDLNQA